MIPLLTTYLQSFGAFRTVLEIDAVVARMSISICLASGTTHPRMGKSRCSFRGSSQHPRNRKREPRLCCFNEKDLVLEDWNALMQATFAIIDMAFSRLKRDVPENDY